MIPAFAAAIAYALALALVGAAVVFIGIALLRAVWP